MERLMESQGFGFEVSEIYKICVLAVQNQTGDEYVMIGRINNTRLYLKKFLTKY
jgi:hypothetical protein